MVFSSNPLSLSVPDPVFESWLRDSGYLEVLDDRTSAVAAAAAAAPSTTSADDSVSSITGGFFGSLLITLLSLLTLNPFAKLTTDDFAAETASWTVGFFGSFGSYSFPSSSSQARMRVHENVKRYARNYATLFIVFFACTLYQMPLALFGLLASLALWELFQFCSNRWGFHRYPVGRQVLVRAAQCVTAVILLYLNVQIALFCALAVSYAVLILHAAFRKLAPPSKPSRQR